MLRFIIDEDMPRSVGRALGERGFEAIDVRDAGLRGQDDGAIFHFAQEHQAVLITGDMGFGNIRHFPPGTHLGIVVVRYPNEVPARTVVHDLMAALSGISEDEVRGNITIVEPGRIRIRKRQA